MRKWRIVAIAAVAGASLAFAQGARAQDMTPEMIATWQQYSTPGEAHQVFTDMAGNWTHKVTMWMAPGAPPMESTATSDAEIELGGRWLEEEFSGEMWGQPFRGENLLGYDNFREEYVAIWRDNLSTAAMITRGTYDPATKTLTMTGTMDDFMSGARDIAVRQVVTSPGPGQSTMEMYMPGPDGNEFLTMRIESTKE